MWLYFYLGLAIMDLYLGFTQDRLWFAIAIVILIIARLYGEKDACSKDNS